MAGAGACRYRYVQAYLLSYWNESNPFLNSFRHAMNKKSPSATDRIT